MLCAGMNLGQRAANALLMGVTRSFSVLMPPKTHLDMRCAHYGSTAHVQMARAPTRSA